MLRSSLLAAAALLVVGTCVKAQPIIAQTSGLTNPDQVIDFGANLYPNFSNITTQFAGITVSHAAYFTTGVSNNLVGGFLTNNFSGPPNTLKIKFANPISDLSFVYHQISTAAPSNFRAMLGTTVVDSFSNLSNQNQSQPNNYFGFTNIVFDELQLDFQADFNVDTLAFNDVSATCTVRNGTNINPVDFACVTQPVIGANWLSSIATNANTLASYLAIGLGGPHPGLPLFGGELLLQPSPAPFLIPGSGSFSLLIPFGPWQGVQIPTQGLRVDNVSSTPTVVLLNALDLRLGT